MNFLRKRSLKVAALCLFGAAATGGITAGLVTGFSSTADDFDFIVQATTAASSLNYLRDYQVTSPWTLVNAIEGLFSPRLPASASPVHQLVGISAMPFVYYSKDGAALSDTSSPATSTVISNYVSQGMATTGTISSDGSKRLVMTFDIRTDSYWSDGKQVTADDFVDTVKYVMLPANFTKLTAVTPYLAGYEELEDTMNDDKSITLKQFDSDSKYDWFFKAPTTNSDGTKRGGAAYATITRDPTTQKITSQSVTFTLKTSSDPTVSSISNYISLLSSYSLFYPVNRPFIESVGGYAEFGKTGETFVSNGPFKITEAAFDYQVLYKPNEQYWDKNRVLNKGFLIRVLSDTTTIQGLFKTKKIGTIIITPDQYRVFAADPEIKKFIIKGTTRSYLQGWFYNQDNGPGKEFTRNVHFRRAMTYGIDREKVIAAAGFDGSPPADIYTTEIPQYADENGIQFRDVFLDPKSKDVATSYSFTVNGFKQNMIYYDYRTMLDIRGRELISKVNASKDYQYNPELAKKEFALFEQDMAALGKTQSVYTVRAILAGTNDEQSQVLMDQSLKSLFNGRIRVEGFFVNATIADNYKSAMTSDFDLWPVTWGYDTPDPFSYLRLWALVQDPADLGVKYNVAFGSYLVYTSPKGFTDPNQFPMMDDMERIMGNPTDEASFAAAMQREYGVDWITYADWTATKNRLLAWQESHIAGRVKEKNAKIANGEDVSNYDTSGVVNTEDQILKNGDLIFWLSDGFDTPSGSVPSITINESYRYESIMELVLRVYSAGFTTLQAGVASWAQTLIGSYVTGNYFTQANLSQKLSYVCSNPPKTQWSLPGCEAITDTNLPIQGNA